MFEKITADKASIGVVGYTESGEPIYEKFTFGSRNQDDISVIQSTDDIMFTVANDGTVVAAQGLKTIRTANSIMHGYIPRNIIPKKIWELHTMAEINPNLIATKISSRDFFKDKTKKYEQMHFSKYGLPEISIFQDDTVTNSIPKQK